MKKSFFFGFAFILLSITILFQNCSFEDFPSETGGNSSSSTDNTGDKILKLQIKYTQDFKSGSKFALISGSCSYGAYTSASIKWKFTQTVSCNGSGESCAPIRPAKFTESTSTGSDIFCHSGSGIGPGTFSFSVPLNGFVINSNDAFRTDVTFTPYDEDGLEMDDKSIIRSSSFSVPKTIPVNNLKIGGQPASSTVDEGSRLSLSVIATNNDHTLSYQWRKYDGSTAKSITSAMASELGLEGRNSKTLTSTAAKPELAGEYDVVITSNSWKYLFIFFIE